MTGMPRVADISGGSSAGCKLVVAAASPWCGEMYATRRGHARMRFTSVESFCTAFLATTGWTLQPWTAQSARTRTKSRPDSESPIKFVFAAGAPWSGEVYRTRPGFRHFHFTTFEEFLYAVLAITGWSLDISRPSTHTRAVITRPAAPH